MDERLVRRAVEDAFAALRSVPDWPDPRPGGEAPPDEAYSRVTDPGRYLLVVERAEAWATALVTLGLADLEDVPPGAAGLRRDDPRSGTPSRVTRLVPVAAGALPLVLVTWLPPEGAVDRTACVEIGAGAPAVVVLECDCGCDACDSGSAPLLRQVDDTVLHVLSGAFVHVTTPALTVMTTHDGGYSARGRGGGRERSRRLLADAAAGRSRHPVVTGASWW